MRRILRVSRPRISVEELARIYAVKPETLKRRLEAQGVVVTGAHDRVARHQTALARLVAAHLSAALTSGSRQTQTAIPTRRPAEMSAPSQPEVAPVPTDRAPDAPVKTGRTKPKRAAERAVSPPRWPSQKSEPIDWVTVDDVLAIHTALEDEFRGTPDAVEPPGVKNKGALESAVARAQTAHQIYSTVLLAGSALVHALNSNHAFHNGNKRTSLLALAIFLEKRNGRYLTADEDELYALIVDSARHTLVSPRDSPGRDADPYYSDREVIEIHRRLRAIVTVPTRNDKPMKWRDFVRTIERFGCEVGGIDSNQAKIRRDLPDGRCLTAVAGARNAGTEIDAWQVKGYRKQLELTDEYGIDSTVFYDGVEPHPELPELVRRYRGVLERLSFLDRVGDENEEPATNPQLG